jgi:endoglucanase
MFPSTFDSRHNQISPTQTYALSKPHSLHPVMSRLTIAILILCGASYAAPAAIKYAGVNLSGAEFGHNNLPGTYNTHYTYPNQNEVNYFASRGMNIVLLPFRWERLQQATNAPLNATELNRLHTFVSATTAKGIHVILEPHTFARYYPDTANFQSSTQGLIGSFYPNSVFSNFWWRVAGIYKTNQLVIFNLMNEPNAMPTEQWVSAANAAIAGIRATGATNLIQVPGNQWTGAHAWTANYYGTPNSVAMLNIVDPANHYVASSPPSSSS